MARVRRRQGRCALPLLLAAVGWQVLAAPAREADADLVWENYYVDEQSLADGSSVTASTGTIVTFGRTVFSDNDGGTFDLSPGGNSDYVTFERGRLGGHRGYLELSFDNENDDPADYVELALNFDEAVTNLQFSLLDVDGTRRRDDGVEVFYNGSNNARDNSAIGAVTGALTSIDSHPYMHGWEGIGVNAGVGQTLGNIDFDFGSLAITSLRIRYFSTSDPIANPIAQEIGVSDLRFVRAVPEADSLAYMALFGSTLLVGHQIRGRRRIPRGRRERPIAGELRLFIGDEPISLLSRTPPPSEDTAEDAPWIIPFPDARRGGSPSRRAA